MRAARFTATLVASVPFAMAIALSSEAAAYWNTCWVVFGVSSTGSDKPELLIGMPLQKSDATCSSA